MSTEARRRKRIRALQRYVLNTPVKAAVWTGLVPGYVLLETTGRRSGKRRRTVVGLHRVGEHGWVVAEQGRHAGYVRNLQAHSRVRVRTGRRWRPATARVLEGEDPQARLDTFGRPYHASTVRRFGTELVTIEVDFSDRS